MKYYFNKNIKLTKINTIWLLSNFDNQAVIGLDEQGVDFWELLKSEKIDQEKIEENQELYDSLFELYFLSCSDKIENKNGLKISSAYVHLLNRCNLSCLGCYSMNDERNMELDATTDEWKLAFKRLAMAGVSSLVISGGEPLLRKDIAELIKYAKSEAKIDNITLITNGTVKFRFEQLKDYIDTIAVSVDGYDKEHPTFLRNSGIFDTIMDTVRSVKDIGINVSIVPTIHMKNYEAMKLYDELAEKLQVAISFSILSVPCNEIFAEYVPNDTALCKMAEDIFNLNAEVQDMTTAGEGLCAMKSCGLGQNMVSVDSKGNIYPCHILHDDNLLLGNIFDNNLVLENLNSEVLEMCSKANVDNIVGCQLCEYRYLCGGGCRGRAYLREKNLMARDSYCKLFYKFHEIEMSTIQQGIQDAK